MNKLENRCAHNPIMAAVRWFGPGDWCISAGFVCDLKKSFGAGQLWERRNGLVELNDLKRRRVLEVYSIAKIVCKRWR